jgi:sigma-B regulation protein RsbU (phosphoserine phosphatase)
MDQPAGSRAAPADALSLIGSDTLASLDVRACAAGSLLFRPGDPDDQLYIILSGEVALVDGFGTPEERVVHVRGADAFIGEMTVLSPHILPHRFAGRVLTDAELLVVRRADVDALLRREPLLAYELLRVSSFHMRRARHHAMRELEAKNEQLVQTNDALRAAQAQLLEHERVQQDLRLAREVQERMLPTELLRVAGANLGARFLPAREVAGDFYDLFLLDEEHLGFVIGDVCGKGIAAALYMAETRALLRASAAPDAPPDAVLHEVNRHLLALNGGAMFVTAVYGRVHIPSGRIALARAGHEYPLVYTAGWALREQPRAVGQPLGILEEPALDVQSLLLDAGDTLLLYTDGVTEATNASGAFFERARLQAAVCSAQAATAQDLCDHIVREVAAFQGDASQADDLTLLALRAI